MIILFIGLSGKTRKAIAEQVKSPNEFLADKLQHQFNVRIVCKLSEIMMYLIFDFIECFTTTFLHKKS